LPHAPTPCWLGGARPPRRPDDQDTAQPVRARPGAGDWRDRAARRRSRGRGSRTDYPLAATLTACRQTEPGAHDSGYTRRLRPWLITRGKAGTAFPRLAITSGRRQPPGRRHGTAGQRLATDAWLLRCFPSRAPAAGLAVARAARGARRIE